MASHLEIIFGKTKLDPGEKLDYFFYALLCRIIRQFQN